MTVKQFIIKALCVTICLASSPLSNEDIAREFIEHVLRIPNPDKVLNSALDRIEKNRQHEMIKQQVSSKADCEDSTELLPEYTETLQGSRELRQLGAQKHYPICHLERKIKKLNTNEYEYRPAYYEEVRCTSNEDIGVTNEICSSLGFACVQWNKTIHLTRRRYTSDCWETRTMVIPAGCECMWPVHRLGDMKLRI
ncbi:uncharacterized protein LOC113493925 [Trichoplusia ni]|uniref:Uncharacterized protein LOC113493925 n=1 Tax=Trichoplusia ni TaxID=7111 RepID=A0A7E5VHT0_TRINI|nr:uncharacterized protein LOC113493925 [Trichoplusia ni]